MPGMPLLANERSLPIRVLKFFPYSTWIEIKRDSLAPPQSLDILQIICVGLNGFHFDNHSSIFDWKFEIRFADVGLAALGYALGEMSKPGFMMRIVPALDCALLFTQVGNHKYGYEAKGRGLIVTAPSLHRGRDMPYDALGTRLSRIRCGRYKITPPHPTLSRLGRGQKIPGCTRIEDVYSLIRSVRRRFRAAAISRARGRAKLPGCRSSW